MKVKYSKPKGQRLKSQFWGLREYDDPNKLRSRFKYLWWCEINKKWITTEERYAYEKVDISNYNNNIKTVKSAIRHLRKQTYLAKGTQFFLSNKCVDYDVIITI